MWIKVYKVVASKNITKCFCTRRNVNKIPTAGIIVIGDEILKGEVQDTNSAFMAKELHQLGLRLKKISVIGDNIQEVATEVKYYSQTFDYVLTTGGIGPTHDDITFEAVALAFDQPLHFHPELKKICMRFYNTEQEDYPGMKLAYVPKLAKLTYPNIEGLKMQYPTISVNNVYMYPGIPELLEKSLKNLGPKLFKSDVQFFSKCVYCNLTEDRIAAILDKLVKEFPKVQFGSYPKFQYSAYKVKLTMESTCEESTTQAYEKLLTLIPPEYIVPLNEI